MAKVRITTPRVGTTRFRDDIIAEYYERGDEPEWRTQDDGTRVARMKKDCAAALVDEYDNMEHVGDTDQTDANDVNNENDENNANDSNDGDGDGTDDDVDEDA